MFGTSMHKTRQRQSSRLPGILAANKNRFTQPHAPASSKTHVDLPSSRSHRSTSSRRALSWLSIFTQALCLSMGHSQIRRATLAHLGRGAARDLPFGTRTPGEA